ncbi:MAG: discoidin domain-containing protein, partial [Chloroflexi bacterium]|nr:discoidin domain-containing protein [Chloroflexota bacterium]
MKRTLLVGLTLCTIISLTAGCLSCSRSEPAAIPSAPRLTNNPNWDIIATNERPLLTFFNASGGVGDRTYTIQIDEVDTFDSSALVQYKDVPEEHEYITSKRVEEEDALQDETRYLWRVRAVDSKGHEGTWALSRFFLDTKSDDSFMNLIRIPVQQVTVSSSQNPKNIIDYDDPGQATFWQAAPPGDLVPWVEFALGQTWTVSRIWILSSLSDRDGWLKDFAWQRSVDGQTWLDIQGASTTGNDTYRSIIDFPPATAR